MYKVFGAEAVLNAYIAADPRWKEWLTRVFIPSITKMSVSIQHGVLSTSFAHDSSDYGFRRRTCVPPSVAMAHAHSNHSWYVFDPYLEPEIAECYNKHMVCVMMKLAFPDALTARLADLQHALEACYGHKRSWVSIGLADLIKAEAAWIERLNRKQLGESLGLGKYVCEATFEDVKMKIFRLESKEDYQKEGQVMKHCVASYHGRENPIFSVRNNKERLWTFEWDVYQNRIKQLRGYKNSLPANPSALEEVLVEAVQPHVPARASVVTDGLIYTSTGISTCASSTIGFNPIVGSISSDALTEERFTDLLEKALSHRAAPILGAVVNQPTYINCTADQNGVTTPIPLSGGTQP